MVYTSRTLFARAGAWREFVTRRLVRIVPVYWFFTTLLAVVALALPSALQKATVEPLHLFLSYAFIPHLGPAGSLHPFLEVGWTLNYEMCFYAVFAALLFLPVRRMLIALTMVFAAAVVIGGWLTPEAGAAYFWTRPIVLGFVGGAWVGHAFVSGARLPGRAVWLIPVLAVVLLAFPAAPLPLRPWIIQACAIVCVMLATLPIGMASRPVPRVFGALGDASYSVYLAHPFILTAMALMLRDLPAWARFAGGGLAALVGGHVLYLLIEKPALNLARRALARRGDAGGSRAMGARLPRWATCAD